MTLVNPLRWTLLFILPLLGSIAYLFLRKPSLSSSDSSPTERIFEDPCKSIHFSARSVHKVEGERVLVTGGSGFIGSHLVDLLLSLNYSVTVLDNLSTGSIEYLDLSNPRLTLVIGDIENRTDLDMAFKNVSGVFHLAAASKVAPSLKDPRMATFNVQTNSVGTANVLEMAANLKVKKFVYAASSTYYGNQKVPFSENASFVPSSPYAASKYMGELQTMTYDKLFDLPAVNLRFFMVYGPRQPSTGAYAVVTGKFHDQKMQGLPLTIEGDGSQFRDFVHVQDVVRACVLAYQNPTTRGVTINIGSGEAFTVKELANLISDNQVYKPARLNDLKGTLASTCAAKRLLGFSTIYNFKEEVLKSFSDSSIWKLPDVIEKVSRFIPEWIHLSTIERNQAILNLDVSMRNMLLQSIHTNS